MKTTKITNLKIKTTAFVILVSLGYFAKAQSTPMCFIATTPSVMPSVGSNPHSVATADFNNDGKVDIAVANMSTNNVSVLIATGLGYFATAVNYPTGIESRGVTTGDFNGDGKPDLAVANANSGNISILIGTGTGAFGAAVNYPVGSSPYSVISADFNGDGKADLAVANVLSNNISILIGSGTGTFATAVNYIGATNPISITSGDFNTDGNVDLAVVNQNSANVSIFLGSGTGTFSPLVNFTVGTSPRSVTAADFNNDGKLDLAVANAFSNNVSILLGSGSGTFLPAVNYTTGSGPYSISASDFNGDGNMDLAIGYYIANNVSVFAGNGSGAFPTTVNYFAGSNPATVCLGDFNSDGYKDVAVANFTSHDLTILLNCAIRGAALNFDGVNDQVSLGNTMNTILDPLNKITVEAWVKPTTTVGYGTIVGNYSTPAANMQFLLRRDLDQYTFWVDNGGGWQVVSSPVATATVGIWQHVVGVWDGSKTSIYVNGVSLATNTLVTGGTFITTTNSIVIGYTTGAEKFTGNIDEVRIWTAARTSCEINTYKNCEIPTTAFGLLANYHFNQGVSEGANGAVTTLTDFAGSAYIGTLLSFNLAGATSNWTAPGGVTSSYTVALPAPIITVSSGSICVSASYTMVPVGGITYSYSPSGPIVTPIVNSTYTVTGAAVTGCTNSAVSSVTVNSIPSVSVTSGAICAGQSFTMVASGASTYMYTGGSAVVTPTANMSYSVTGTSSVGCVSSNTAVSTVTVNANPTISASASSTIICAGEATTLSSVSSTTTYTWNTGATTASLSVSPTATTNYTVSTTGTNGCSAIANVNITVNACTGINELTSSLISVYPNPNNGIVNITLTAALTQNSTLEIYDALGKLVVKQVLANELNAVNMSNLDNGIYTFKVLNNNNTVKIGKLIKQ